ncbi:MAG: dimethylargininase [Propionibacteriaceae bacterium]
MESRHALVRRPSARMRDGRITHIARSSDLDFDLALRQWCNYVDAFTAAGWTTHEVPVADDCPDSAFVEDTMVVYGDLAVISRSSAAERRPETVAAEETARACGYRVARILEPGTLDGGDVLKFGGTVWVGVGGRTNDAGVKQLRAHLAPLGADVVAVPVRKVLHLKSAVTALPDGSIVGHRPLVDDPDVWAGRFLDVPEESGAHVVLLGDRTVLMAASAPQTVALVRARNLEVITVDISEFEKMEGCVTCLSVRMRGLDQGDRTLGALLGDDS